jgi:hypothetical protein
MGTSATAVGHEQCSAEVVAGRALASRDRDAQATPVRAYVLAVVRSGSQRALVDQLDDRLQDGGILAGIDQLFARFSPAAAAQDRCRTCLSPEPHTRPTRLSTSDVLPRFYRLMPAYNVMTYKLI